MTVTIGVTNTEHLGSVVNKLTKNKNIISVTRG
jgi:(p)ppGpp synthase/HD superfamily hydrolase